jgi:hypothetical protein
MNVVVEFLGMTGCQSRMTGTALPITSALRFWPWGPLGTSLPQNEITQHYSHQNKK